MRAMLVRRSLTLLLATAAAAAAPATALAKGGDDDRVERRGTCTGRSSSEHKIKSDDGRLETEFELDQNRNGVRWRVTLRRNGAVVVSTRATTRAPSGSFSVERRIASGGTITARAVSPSGEVCTARASL
jgi:hypothetical protein